MCAKHPCDDEGRRPLSTECLEVLIRSAAGQTLQTIAFEMCLSERQALRRQVKAREHYLLESDRRIAPTITATVARALICGHISWSDIAPYMQSRQVH